MALRGVFLPQSTDCSCFFCFKTTLSVFCFQRQLLLVFVIQKIVFMFLVLVFCGVLCFLRVAVLFLRCSVLEVGVLRREKNDLRPIPDGFYTAKKKMPLNKSQEKD